MWFRRPEPRPFAVAFGVLVGLAGFLATPRPWPTDPVLSIAVGACVGVLAWAAVEQKPDAVDQVVEARAHWLLAGFGVLLAVGVFGPGVFGGPTPDEGTSIRLLVFALATIVVTEFGSRHRGALLRERGQVQASVTAVESRLQEIALSVGASAGFAGVFSLATGDLLSTGTVVGAVIGTTIGSVLTSRQEYELVALDDYLLLQQTSGRGATAVPWRRLRDVTVDGDTLRVARGLPWPVVYTVDLSEVDDRRAVLEAFRSYPYLH